MSLNIKHEGKCGVEFVCSNCKTICSPGHYYIRIGNDVFCSRVCQEQKIPTLIDVCECAVTSDGKIIICPQHRKAYLENSSVKESD